MGDMSGDMLLYWATSCRAHLLQHVVTRNSQSRGRGHGKVPATPSPPSGRDLGSSLTGTVRVQRGGEARVMKL